MRGLAFDPVVGIPEIVIFLIIAVGAAIWLYRRLGLAPGRPAGATALLAFLRTVGIAAMVLLLLNPVLTQAERTSSRPPLLILFDTSHSMSVADMAGQRRIDAARSALLKNGEIMRRLQARYRCIGFSMADTAVRESLDALASTVRPDGEHTYIGQSLQAALANAPADQTGGLLLISDGRDNGDLDPIAAARMAKLRHMPVFTLCVGTTEHGRDVALLNIRPQVYAAPDQPVPLSAEVSSVGYSGQTDQVELTKDGHVVDTKPVLLDDRQEVPVSFTVQQPKQGSFRYGISVRPMPGEATVSNNTGSVFLQVLKARARVLVLEGEPSWDTKFLVQALHTDPSIDVDAIYQLSNTKTFAVAGIAPQAVPGAAARPKVQVPKTAADFAKYDVVIVGRGCDPFFSQPGAAGALESYVADHAGNLIFLRGKAQTGPDTLSALEPVMWSDREIDDIRLAVTDEGRQNPAFDFTVNPDPQTVVQKLPDLLSATRVDGEKALSVVLARAQGVPGVKPDQEMAVLAYQNYGQGKVVSLAGEGLWKWALLPPELKDYAGCYNDFWTQLVRWMVNQSDFLPGQQVSLKTDRTNYTPGSAVNLMAFVRGRAGESLPPVTILAPDGQSTKVQLGKAGGAQPDFVGVYRPRATGEYLASIAAPNSQPVAGAVMAAFSVLPDSEEDLVTAADPALMQQIAHAGGGEAVSLSDLSSLPAKLRVAQAALVTKTERQSAWDRGWLLALLLGILCLEWGLRRRFGLV